MKKYVSMGVVLFAGLLTMGCGSEGHTYEPPVNTGDGSVPEDVMRDAGVATDPAVMGAGANSN